MNKILNYQNIPFGPYVMKTKMPDYIIKKLKTVCRKTKENYNY